MSNFIITNFDNFYICCYYTKLVIRNNINKNGLKLIFFKNLKNYNISKKMLRYFKGSVSFIVISNYNIQFKILFSLNLPIMFILYKYFIYFFFDFLIFLNDILSFFFFFSFFYIFFFNKLLFLK